MATSSDSQLNECLVNIFGPIIQANVDNFFQHLLNDDLLKEYDLQPNRENYISNDALIIDIQEEFGKIMYQNIQLMISKMGRGLQREAMLESFIQTISNENDEVSKSIQKMHELESDR